MKWGAYWLIGTYTLHVKGETLFFRVTGDFLTASAHVFNDVKSVVITTKIFVLYHLCYFISVEPLKNPEILFGFVSDKSTNWVK